MDDIRKKIDGLAAQLGMVPAKDLRQDKPKKDAVNPVPDSDAVPQVSSGTGGILSSELAAQLRARLGLNTEITDSLEHDTADGNTLEIEELLPGEIVGDEHYGFFLYRQVFPLDYPVGEVPLGAGMACDGRQIALSACDDQLLAFDPCKTCYVDTETTGLAGGAGTVAFLVGLGFFREDAFVLEQCFLRDYDDEGAMLEYLAEKLQEFDCVVSDYNGKSFDLPLLRARFVQHRLPFPLQDVAHFDLVHAARRVWKKRLSDCSLGNIERLVLGFQRQEDVPGYLIPQLWLNYLETRDARSLKNVFHHHEMDILSLAALAGHISQRLAITDGTGFHHAEDQLSVIRLYYKNKEYASVMEHARQFLEASQVADRLRRECLSLLGQAAKRLFAFEEMHNAWKTLHEEFPEDSAGAAELAKYLEHQFKDCNAAARVCRETLNAIEDAVTGVGLAGDLTISALRGRLKRLEGKLTRQRQKGGDREPFFEE